MLFNGPSQHWWIGIPLNLGSTSKPNVATCRPRTVSLAARRRCSGRLASYTRAKCSTSGATRLHADRSSLTKVRSPRKMPPRTAVGPRLTSPHAQSTDAKCARRLHTRLETSLPTRRRRMPSPVIQRPFRPRLRTRRLMPRLMMPRHLILPIPALLRPRLLIPGLLLPRMPRC